MYSSWIYMHHFLPQIAWMLSNVPLFQAACEQVEVSLGDPTKLSHSFLSVFLFIGKKSVCKKNWRQVKKSQTATEEVHTHASARLCDMQTGSENRAMAQNKGQCFSLSFFDAQIRRQEFHFLLENIGGSSQARKENKHVGRMKQLLSTQKQQMPFLDRKCGFCEKEVYDMFEGH